MPFHKDGMLPLQVVGSAIWDYLRVEKRMDELLELSRTWIMEHTRRRAEHLLEAGRELRRMHPGAKPAMLLAALTPAMEQAL